MKFATTVWALLAVLYFPITASAQMTVIPAEEKPYIEVTGTAEKEIVPDRIYIRIVIREKYEGKDKITIESQETKLKEAIVAIGVPLEDLSLTDANADYIKVRWKTNDVLTEKDYTLLVKDAATLTKTFRELEKLEIRDAYVVKVDHSQIDEFRKEVKIKAIKAAKDKADYLLAAIGENTGKPLIVREEVYSLYDQRNELLSNMSITEESFGGFYYDNLKVKELGEISFEKIKIKTSMYVKFLIQ